MRRNSILACIVSIILLTGCASTIERNESAEITKKSAETTTKAAETVEDSSIDKVETSDDIILDDNNDFVTPLAEIPQPGEVVLVDLNNPNCKIQSTGKIVENLGKSLHTKYIVTITNNESFAIEPKVSAVATGVNNRVYGTIKDHEVGVVAPGETTIACLDFENRSGGAVGYVDYSIKYLPSVKECTKANIESTSNLIGDNIIFTLKNTSDFSMKDVYVDAVVYDNTNTVIGYFSEEAICDADDELKAGKEVYGQIDISKIAFQASRVEMYPHALVSDHTLEKKPKVSSDSFTINTYTVKDTDKPRYCVTIQNNSKKRVGAKVVGLAKDGADQVVSVDYFTIDSLPPEEVCAELFEFNNKNKIDTIDYIVYYTKSNRDLGEIIGNIELSTVFKTEQDLANEYDEYSYNEYEENDDEEGTSEYLKITKVGYASVLVTNNLSERIGGVRVVTILFRDDGSVENILSHDVSNNKSYIDSDETVESTRYYSLGDATYAYSYLSAYSTVLHKE